MPRQFRVVDLLMVLGVSAVLLGLASSALSPRIAPPRIQCLSNMRQVALGVIQYQNVHGVFPLSAFGPADMTERHTGLIWCLPYLEGQELYNAYNIEQPSSAEANRVVVETRISLFLCRANPHHASVPANEVRTIDGTSYPGTSRFAPGHFAFNWGGGRMGWGAQFERAEGQNRGVLLPVLIGGAGKTPHGVRLSDITDGAAMTLLITEKRDSQGWAVGGWAGSEFDVGGGPAYPGENPWAKKVYSGSYHPDRINAVTADGAARAFRPTMDRRIWWAVITRNGAELVAPDDWE